MKALKDLNVNRTNCFVHNIQLALKTGIFLQKSVVTECVITYKVVCHFKHSSAIDSFVDIQKELSLPTPKLIQDVPRRWNSTFNILERLMEQKRAIIAYSSDESGELNLPSVQQWKLIDKILILLHQFSELTANANLMILFHTLYQQLLQQNFFLKSMTL